MASVRKAFNDYCYLKYVDGKWKAVCSQMHFAKYLIIYEIFKTIDTLVVQLRQ